MPPGAAVREVLPVARPPNFDNIVRLPNFWTTEPEAWYEAIEAFFAARGITDTVQMYHAVLVALPAPVTRNLRDIWRQPVDEDSYQRLKARLIEAYTMTLEQRARMLLHLPDLGDRSPDDLMADVMRYLGDEDGRVCNSSIVSGQITPSRSGCDQELRRDGFFPCGKDGHPVDGNPVQLVQAVAAAHVQPAGNARRAQPRRQRRQNQGNAPAANNSWCYYHNRFGDRARNCRQPCTFRQARNVNEVEENDDDASENEVNWPNEVADSASFVLSCTLMDDFNNKMFTVDSGAEISVLPPPRGPTPPI